MSERIKFHGVDSHNRPVFKSLDRKKTFYGCTDKLFSVDATEVEVLRQVKEEDLCFFGFQFGCEPMGTASTNIEIQEPDPLEGCKLMSELPKTKPLPSIENLHVWDFVTLDKLKDDKDFDDQSIIDQCFWTIRLGDASGITRFLGCEVDVLDESSTSSQPGVFYWDEIEKGKMKTFFVGPSPIGIMITGTRKAICAFISRGMNKKQSRAAKSCPLCTEVLKALEHGRYALNEWMQIADDCDQRDSDYETLAEMDAAIEKARSIHE